MRTDDEIRESVYHVLENMIHEDAEISDDSELHGDLGIDSLDKIALVMDMEEAFNVDLDEGDFLEVQTVGQVLDYMTAFFKNTDQT
jgi:acyl carrier protein